MGFEDVIEVLTKMQLLVQDSSELLMTITLIFGAIILANYTRKRTAELSPDERSAAGQPLYLSVVGILALAAGSFYNFIIDLDTAPLLVSGTYYTFTLAAATIFTIAALMILEYRKAIVIPIILLASSLIFIYAIALLNLPISMGMVLHRKDMD